jgi:hypothetical protein
MRIMFRLIVACHVLLAVGGANAGRAQQSSLTLDEVVSGLQKFQAVWRERPCWKIHYSETRQSFFIPPDFRKDHPDSDYVIAQKGEFLYAYEKVMEKPYPEVWVAWKDNVCTHRFLDGNYKVLPEIHPRLFETWHYPQNLFIDTYQKTHFIRSKTMISVMGTDSLSESMWYALPRGIERKRSEWIVRPTADEIDGQPCTVLVRTVDGSPKDIVWVDPAHGFISRQRRYYNTPNQLGWEWKNLAIKEIVPGVWLPMQQQVSVYNRKSSMEPKDIEGKLRFIRTFSVKEISFEPLSDDFFVAPAVKEGIVMDMIRGETYNVYRGASDPETLVRKAINEARSRSSEGKDPTGFFFYNLIVLLALLLIYQGYKLYQRRKVLLTLPAKSESNRE